MIEEVPDGDHGDSAAARPGSTRSRDARAVRGVSREDYLALAQRLPSSFRVAFDGKDIEMMVTSRDHNQVGWLMARLAEAVIERIGMKFVPCGRAPWPRRCPADHRGR